MSVFTSWAATSLTGRVRPGNEDSAFAGRWLYAVADGMGGHAAGEVASAAVITSLGGHDEAVPAERLAAVLAAAVLEANAAIRQRTEADPALRTMGTTLTAMLWARRTFALAHIGDSRAYRLRGGQLRQLTEDHAMVNLVSNAGTVPVLAPAMTRFLDGRPDRSPDLMIQEALPGDRYLLCSDGLSSVVPIEIIRAVLGSGEDLGRAAAQLAELANEEGGPDNITAVLVDVLDKTAAEDTAAPVTLGAAALVKT
jgi:serine/threonine protein phosphatase PrpC